MWLKSDVFKQKLEEGCGPHRYHRAEGGEPGVSLRQPKCLHQVSYQDATVYACFSSSREEWRNIVASILLFCDS